MTKKYINKKVASKASKCLNKKTAAKAAAKSVAASALSKKVNFKEMATIPTDEPLPPKRKPKKK